MKQKNPIILTGFILLLLVVVIGSYLYFVYFESLISFIAGISPSALADNSPSFYDSWDKVIPYKRPLLYYQAASSFLLVIYAFYIKSITPTYFIRIATVFSTILFLFYLLLVCLSPIIPYGGMVG
jgi:hypothetical protein